MAEVPKEMPADLEALAARLAHAEHAFLDTRIQVESAPKAAATPLVDTRTIGKAPKFTGKHKDWPE